MLPASLVTGYGATVGDVMGDIPDLAPSDIHRFGPVKKHLAGK